MDIITVLVTPEAQRAFDAIKIFDGLHRIIDSEKEKQEKYYKKLTKIYFNINSIFLHYHRFSQINIRGVVDELDKFSLHKKFYSCTDTDSYEKSIYEVNSNKITPLLVRSCELHDIFYLLMRDARFGNRPRSLTMCDIYSVIDNALLDRYRQIAKLLGKPLI
jgi:hypothetical protein